MMIQSLKRKFVLLAMVSLCLLLALIVTGMNIMSFKSVVTEADIMLDLLTESHDIFPKLKGKMPPDMSPDAPYESRFFTVVLGKNGNHVDVHMDRIAAVDRQTALDFAAEALESGKERGFIGDFRYVIIADKGHHNITFLDCGRRLDAFRVFLQSSVVMSLLGLCLIFFIMMFSAQRIIRPVAESHEKQKRFITDAGHEIKTPLTIISANIDLLELDIGENECLSDIRHQTKRLSSLTNDLVCLARMEEAGKHTELLELPVSEIVQESAAPFKALAQSLGKDLICDIEPMLSMKADHKSLEQLVSILLDNAVKYSPQATSIYLSLKKAGKTLRLEVKNKSLTVLSQESINQLFERFYRADSSRNSSTGGHGIGLSIAKAIVSLHGGKIQARSPDGKELEITAVFPV